MRGATAIYADSWADAYHLSVALAAKGYKSRQFRDKVTAYAPRSVIVAAIDRLGITARIAPKGGARRYYKKSRGY